MRRIMRILGIIAIMALLLGGGASVLLVAAPEVTVSIDAPDEAAPDSDFTANVNINEVVDFDACNYDVSFDASVLRLDNVTSGLIGSTTIPVDIYNEITPGTYRIVQSVPGLTGATGSGYLAVLHFHVIGSEGDSSNISLSNGILANNLAEEIAATWVGDSVSVSDSTPPSVTIAALTPDPTNDNTPTFTGTATDASSNISSVEYKVDDGSWTAATASDGAFDSLSENYTFTTSELSDGAHTVYVRATDSATNTTAEADYASDGFTVDATAPSVTSTSPAADATDVAVDTTVSVTFSEAMDESTITTGSFILVADSTPVSGSVSYDSGTYTATFTPSADLAENTTCTATLSTAITDAAGNPLAAGYSWSFTTVQTVIPGDGNGDGAVDARDITKVERVVGGLDAETPGADANQDGTINALDITKVERIAAGLG